MHVRDVYSYFYVVIVELIDTPSIVVEQAVVSAFVLDDRVCLPFYLNALKELMMMKILMMISMMIMAMTNELLILIICR
jgi:hypothetical protein